jgi:hypothetical protein
VTRRFCFLFPAVLLGAAACSRAPKNEEAIRQAVIEHLQKNTGLDMNAMTVEVTKVEYRGNEADATIAFKPKNMPEGGMSMNYSFTSEGGRWQVKKRADSGGMGANPHTGEPAAGSGAQGQLPAGHPPTSGASSQGAQGQLPAGHPPVAPPKTDAPKPGAAKTK